MGQYEINSLMEYDKLDKLKRYIRYNDDIVYFCEMEVEPKEIQLSNGDHVDAINAIFKINVNYKWSAWFKNLIEEEFNVCVTSEFTFN